ncbi:MAG: hypothetical protein ABW133_15000, partial [Polyangiaceae bacterium]
MLRRSLALLLCLSGCTGSASTAPCPTSDPRSGIAARGATEEAPRPAARASDVASIDAILAALYGSVSGPPGPRDWDRVRSLFAPGARVAPVEKRDGGAAAQIMDLDSFVA